MGFDGWRAWDCFLRDLSTSEHLRTLGSKSFTSFRPSDILQGILQFLTILLLKAADGLKNPAGFGGVF